ncbi:HAD family hydrolase [Roseivivax sp. CAU 1753]
MGGPVGIKAILFDKDGTLFDFRATWEGWASAVIRALADGCPGLESALCDAVRFDLGTGHFHPDSPVIAGTNDEVAARIADALPGLAASDIAPFLIREAQRAPLVPAVPLAAYLSGLNRRGLRLGVMTNDAEDVALSHLRSADITQYFSFVAGFDSGYGAKPDPAPLLAFARHLSLAPDQVVMVGDSTHDLIAAKAAGMTGVGVLTGLADRATLAAHAAVVLPDIGHLDAWLSS